MVKEKEKEAQLNEPRWCVLVKDREVRVLFLDRLGVAQWSQDWDFKGSYGSHDEAVAAKLLLEKD
jgi:hypothetical protein